MSDIRTIKKYPNRRLYDTTISSYITVHDIRQLVMDEVSFKVVDAKSGADLTRSILLQIISEQEEAGDPIFTSDMLTQFIRYYGDNVQNMFSSYLDRSMKVFVEQQQQFNDQMHTMVTGNPVTIMSEIAERNMDLWRNFQDQFFKTGKGGDATAPQKKDEGND
jgi:polyhydroxyalkanoate synthesis repressor PhaR